MRFSFRRWTLALGCLGRGFTFPLSRFLGGGEQRGHPWVPGTPVGACMHPYVLPAPPAPRGDDVAQPWAPGEGKEKPETPTPRGKDPGGTLRVEGEGSVRHSPPSLPHT